MFVYSFSLFSYLIFVLLLSGLLFFLFCSSLFVSAWLLVIMTLGFLDWICPAVHLSCTFVAINDPYLIYYFIREKYHQHSWRDFNSLGNLLIWIWNFPFFYLSWLQSNITGCETLATVDGSFFFYLFFSKSCLYFFFLLLPSSFYRYTCTYA